MSLAYKIRALIVTSRLDAFDPLTPSYLCIDASAPIIALADIAAPATRTTIDRERAMAILAAIRKGDALPPVEIDEPPDATGRRYRLRNGFHRYHLSAALGFSHVPVVLRPYFSWNDL
ncbi:hypothetical protein [Lysobacter sp. Root494]|uniref:hypothetical protein n=1 Tax=Lysobacter sp. Root494 TaxID=1736549 RepID=UPI0012F9030C|nr:hypothetical protein [Lysobacter sp. Root494]